MKNLLTKSLIIALLIGSWINAVAEDAKNAQGEQNIYKSEDKPLWRIVVVSRINDCGWGCGTVTESKELRSVFINGIEEVFWAKSIYCDGGGIKSCPQNLPTNETDDGTDYDEWIDVSAEGMYNYAISEMEAGHNSGTHTATYVNVDTGNSLLFEVVWSYQENASGVWEQQVEVAIIHE